ncbi:MAG: serine hydrolase [Clostridia bacterium]|nr:serine hydrolase [Clostridia bacterium]
MAARIVEKVSGLNYAEYVRKNITEPIGMKDTTFTPSEDQWNRLVKLHELYADGNMKAIEADRKYIYGENPLYYC